MSLRLLVLEDDRGTQLSSEQVLVAFGASVEHRIVGVGDLFEERLLRGDSLLGRRNDRGRRSWRGDPGRWCGRRGRIGAGCRSLASSSSTFTSSRTPASNSSCPRPLDGSRLLSPEWNSLARVTRAILLRLLGRIPPPGRIVIRLPVCLNNPASLVAPSSAVAAPPDVSSRVAPVEITSSSPACKSFSSSNAR